VTLSKNVLPLLAAALIAAPPAHSQTRVPAPAPGLTLANVGVLYGDTAHFRAKLTGGETGSPIDFFVDGAKVGRAGTAADGTAAFDWDLPEGIKAGAHPIAAALPPAGAARPEVRAAASMDVLRAKLWLTADLHQPNPSDVKNSTTYQVDVAVSLKEDAAKHRLVKATVEVAFRGQKKTVTTSEGPVGGTPAAVAHFTVGPNDYGMSVKAQAAFDGDGRYLPATAESLAITLMTPQGAVPQFRYEIASKQTKPLRLGEACDVAVRVMKADGSPFPGAVLHGYGQDVNDWTSNTGTPGVDLGTATAGPDGRAVIHYRHEQATIPGLYHLSGRYVLNGQTFPAPWGAEYADDLRIAATPLVISFLAPAKTAPGTTAKIKVHIERETDHQATGVGGVRLYEGPVGPNATVVVQKATDAAGDVWLDLPVAANAALGTHHYWLELELGARSPYTAERKTFTMDVAK
jgi:hypothetical protein